MTKLLISPFVLVGCLLASLAHAQAISPSFVAVSATASAFQVIDDARAENGDADLLYIQAAVARNEAAIEAAKTILKSSFDADIRMLAGDSLKVHDTELRTLKAWLNLHGPNEVPAPVAASGTPTEPKSAVVAAIKSAAAIPATAPVSASLPVTPVKPLPASTEVTITTPRVISPTEPQPPLPGANISMQPMAEPTMQLLDIPTVPVSLTPVTP